MLKNIPKDDLKNSIAIVDNIEEMMSKNISKDDSCCDY